MELEKLTKEQAEQLVQDEKARFLGKENPKAYCVYQNKLWVQRSDGYFLYSVYMKEKKNKK